MNTFVTSTLVDVLDPVAADTGLGETLHRARGHLSAQIEGQGLVRYHGLPDAPTIGRLGCAITPDADNTALVWRIAPGGKPSLLRAALATLGEYRTAEGLYRTWLAHRDRYQCLDPGKDPNPTDVAIQMNVLLLLAQADPPASRALCRALAGAADEDRVWVYYRMAPLVPILRQADLEKAGCTLALPAARLRAAVPEQEDWVTAATLLRRYAGPHQTTPASEETLALLRKLAANDFSFVRANPPLLYHNDGTATTPRFYWSEDFGYALWLRLFSLSHDRGRPLRNLDRENQQSEKRREPRRLPGGTSNGSAARPPGSAPPQQSHRQPSLAAPRSSGAEASHTAWPVFLTVTATGIGSPATTAWGMGPASYEAAN